MSAKKVTKKVTNKKPVARKAATAKRTKAKPKARPAAKAAAAKAQPKKTSRVSLLAPYSQLPIPYQLADRPTRRSYLSKP